MTTAPRAFALTYRRDGADAVVEVSGEVDLSSAPQLRQGLADLIDEQGNLSIVIDLRDLDFIDSTGLNVLAQAQQHVHRSGGRIILAHVPAMAQKVLEISGLVALFDIGDDDATGGHRAHEG